MNVFRVLGLVLLLPFSLGAEDASVTMSTHIYKRVDGRELQVDVFQPARHTGDVARPAIAFFHGGGWVFGDRNEFHGACRRYAARGFVTATFQYRLSVNADGTYSNPNVTLAECVKDARSAVRWLRAHADEFAIATDRIVVSGQSAGGQLAWATALLDEMNDSCQGHIEGEDERILNSAALRREIKKEPGVIQKGVCELTARVRTLLEGDSRPIKSHQLHGLASSRLCV